MFNKKSYKFPLFFFNLRISCLIHFFYSPYFDHDALLYTYWMSLPTFFHYPPQDASSQHTGLLDSDPTTASFWCVFDSGAPLILVHL